MADTLLESFAREEAERVELIRTLRAELDISQRHERELQASIETLLRRAGDPVICRDCGKAVVILQHMKDSKPKQRTAYDLTGRPHYKTCGQRQFSRKV